MRPDDKTAVRDGTGILIEAPSDRPSESRSKHCINTARDGIYHLLAKLRVGRRRLHPLADQELRRVQIDRSICPRTFAVYHRDNAADRSGPQALVGNAQHRDGALEL